jgi:hypothetical protein
MGGFLVYVITCSIITKLCLWEQRTYFQDNFGLQNRFKVLSFKAIQHQLSFLEALPIPL